MGKLIDQQAAIDALIALTVYSKKREIVKEADNHPNTWIEGVAECIDEIEDLPSAQSEIIHCKDCIWYELPSHKITENCVRWMKSNGILLPIKPDDFCSRAERRTDD